MHSAAICGLYVGRWGHSTVHLQEESSTFTPEEIIPGAPLSRTTPFVVVNIRARRTVSLKPGLYDRKHKGR